MGREGVLLTMIMSKEVYGGKCFVLGASGMVVRGRYCSMLAILDLFLMLDFLWNFFC